MHSYDVQNCSLAEVRALFEAGGVSVAEWARENGFSSGLVYEVLKGQRKCLRGQSHRIAIALGLKSGQSLDVKAISRLLKERSTHPVKTDKEEDGKM